MTDEQTTVGKLRFLAELDYLVMKRLAVTLGSKLPLP